MADFIHINVITDAGKAAIANALLTATAVDLTEFAVGSGDVTGVANLEAAAALVTEEHRGIITAAEVDPETPGIVTVEFNIPAAIGGFTITEWGLFDSAGNLFAIGNYPASFKATDTTDATVRVRLVIGNTEAINLVIDPTVAIASRKYVDDKIAAQKIADHADVTIMEPVNGQVLVRQGGDWINGEIDLSSIDVLRKQILLNSLLDAMGEGAALRVINAVADPFADTSKIDSGASSGYVHDAGGAFISNAGVIAVPGADGVAIGNMPNNGGLASAFDDVFIQSHLDAAAADAASVAAKVAYVGKTWPSPKIIKKVEVQGTSSVGFVGAISPNVTLEIQGSDDGFATHDVLGTVTFVDDTVLHTLNLASDTAYAAHRLKISHDGAENGMHVAEVRFHEFTAQDATLVSTAFEATVEPADGFIIALVEPVDAVTYGADLLADMSKDDGATWEAAALTKIGVTEDGFEVVYGEVTFATVGDQTVRWRLTTANSKRMNLHGVVPDAVA